MYKLMVFVRQDRLVLILSLTSIWFANCRLLDALRSNLCRTLYAAPEALRSNENRFKKAPNSNATIEHVQKMKQMQTQTYLKYLCLEKTLNMYLV